MLKTILFELPLTGMRDRECTHTANGISRFGTVRVGIQQIYIKPSDELWHTLKVAVVVHVNRARLSLNHIHQQAYCSPSDDT
jgi:hypothetical protein